MFVIQGSDGEVAKHKSLTDAAAQISTKSVVKAEDYRIEMIMFFGHRHWDIQEPQLVAVHKKPEDVDEMYHFVNVNLCGDKPRVRVEHPVHMRDQCVGNAMLIDFPRIEFTPQRWQIVRRFASDVETFSRKYRDKLRELVEADPLGFFKTYDGLKEMSSLDPVKKMAKERKIEYTYDPLEEERKKAKKATKEKRK
jgi:hypothetical protein